MTDGPGSRRVDGAHLAADVRRAVERRNRVIAELQQSLVDAEVRESRRALRRALRGGGRNGLLEFVNDDFLAVADRSTIYRAIVDAAVLVGGATCVDLQAYDPATGVLRIVAQQGFPAAFIVQFAAVDMAQPTACAAALRTRRPVAVDDVSRSVIFAGRPSLDAMLDAGSRAVYSYPLIGTGGRVSGVLCFHHGTPARNRSRAGLVARCAAEALARLV